MARPITLLAFFFLSLSVFSTLLTGTGVAETLGLNERVGGEDAADDIRSETESVETGAPTGSTLFGSYNVLASKINDLLGIINPGLRMLYNAGVPASIVGGPQTIGALPVLVSFVKIIGLISFFRGWGL